MILLLFRFSVRHLFLSLIVIALPCGYVSWQRSCLVAEQSAAAQLIKDYHASLSASTINADIYDRPEWTIHNASKGMLYAPVTSVFLVDQHLDTAACGLLERFRHLKNLKIQGCRLSANDELDFLNLLDLKELDISHTPLPAHAVGQIARLRNLERLTLYNCGLSDESLKCLCQLHSLATLHWVQMTFLKSALPSYSRW